MQADMEQVTKTMLTNCISSHGSLIKVSIVLLVRDHNGD